MTTWFRKLMKPCQIEQTAVLSRLHAFFAYVCSKPKPPCRHSLQRWRTSSHWMTSDGLAIPGDSLRTQEHFYSFHSIRSQTFRLLGSRLRNSDPLRWRRYARVRKVQCIVENHVNRMNWENRHRVVNELRARHLVMNELRKSTLGREWIESSTLGHEWI